MKVEKTIFALLSDYWLLRIRSLRITFLGIPYGVYVSGVTKAGISFDYVFEYNDRGNIVWPFKYKNGMKRGLAKRRERREVNHEDIPVLTG